VVRNRTPHAARRFGLADVPASERVQFEQTPLPHEAEVPLPPPKAQPPYRLALGTVTQDPAETLELIAFGDVGGIVDATPQRNVAASIASNPFTANASFVYVVGDVVYYNGDHSDYYPQFYEVYEKVNLPFFAIPGNHDGDNSDNTSVPSLDAFMTNFCAPNASHTADAQDAPRDAMTQPYCYWTLSAALATIVGLYTNVPSGGVVDATQEAWLVEELRAAPAGRALILTLHHPPYSADAYHGGSKQMGDLIDRATKAAGRWPDLILSGHVHDYQRFTRNINNGVPYIVSGAGGYHNLHSMASGIGTLPWPVPGSDVTLEAYDDHDWGWLALSITKTSIAGNYVAVDTSGASRIADTFAVPIAGAPTPPPVPPAPPTPPSPPPQPPVPPTNAQLLDQALAELKQTTVSYSYWGLNPPPPGSHWAKALDLLAKLRQNL
jgi:acid phosphatase type 7